MASVTRKSYGNKDYLGAELKNHRAHTYPTEAAMNADVASATARVVYCVDTARHYFGKPGAWIGLNTASSFGDTVADLSELPVSAADGDVRVVLDDGSGVPTLYIYDNDEPGWKLVADVRLVLKDGSVLLTGILSVEDENVQVPVNPNDLVTKKYSDDELQDHKDDAGAHAAAIAAAVSAGSGADIATHNADPAAHNTTIATAVNSGIATHDSDPAAHATQIATAAAAAIATHEADIDAHHDVITTHVDFHNEDPYAHSESDDSEANSRSGHGVRGNMFVLDVAHGAPLTYDGSVSPVEHYTVVGRADRPVGLAWKQSTVDTLPSTSVTFDNFGSNVVGFSTSTMQEGWLIRFPGSALNTGLFKIMTIVGGSEAVLSPAPVDEVAVSTDAEIIRDDGVVVFSGRFEVDRNEAILNAGAITDIVDDLGDGNGALALTTPIDGKLLRIGDQITVNGTASCDGTYTIRGYSYEYDFILIDGPFPASESAIGTADIDHVAQSHSFGSGGATAVPYYADVDASDGYSTTPGNFLLGQLTYDDTFIVDIERVDLKEVAAVTADITLADEIYQFVPAAIVTPAQTITLPVGREGAVVDLVDSIGGAVANNFTIEGNGSETINGVANLLVTVNYAAYHLKWRGGGWWTF